MQKKLIFNFIVTIFSEHKDSGSAVSDSDNIFTLTKKLRISNENMTRTVKLHSILP